MGVANKRLAHQRDRYGLGHADEAGPIGVAVAVVRGRELYVATVGPAEAYLIRQARLSTLPDPNRDRGLPVEDLEPEVWRGELNVGDSLCLVSANVVAKVGTDALKDALVTLHPQSAIEHLHARFVAADGLGQRRRARVRGERGRRHPQGRTLVPVRPAEPLAGAPDASPIPLADSVTAGAAAVGAGAVRARSAAGNGFQRAIWRTSRTLLLPAPPAGQAQGDRAPRRGWRCSGGRRRRCSRSSPSPARSWSACTRSAAAPAHGRDRVAVGGRARVPGRQGRARPVIGARRRPHHRRPPPALELLNAAYQKLDEAEEGAYPSRADRAAARGGARRPRPAVRRHARRVVVAVHVPGRASRSKLEALVRGSDGAPYVLDTAEQDRLADRPREEEGEGDPARTGRGPRAPSVGDPEAPHDRRSGRPDPRRQEHAVALAAVEQHGQGDAGPGPGHGLGVLGRRRQGHRRRSWPTSTPRSTSCTSSTRPSRTSWSCRRPTTARATRSGPTRRLPTERAGRRMTDLLIDGDIYVAENGEVARVIPASGWDVDPPEDGAVRPNTRLHDDLVARSSPTAPRAGANGACTRSTPATTASSRSTRRTASTSSSTASPAGTTRGPTCAGSTVLPAAEADAPSTMWWISEHGPPQRRSSRRSPRDAAAHALAQRRGRPRRRRRRPTKTPKP